MLDVLILDRVTKKVDRELEKMLKKNRGVGKQDPLLHLKQLFIVNELLGSIVSLPFDSRPIQITPEIIKKDTLLCKKLQKMRIDPNTIKKFTFDILLYEEKTSDTEHTFYRIAVSTSMKHQRELLVVKSNTNLITVIDTEDRNSSYKVWDSSFIRQAVKDCKSLGR